MDAAGSAYLTGFTLSSNFPARDGYFQTRYAGVGDGFVAKLTPGN